MTRIGMGGVAAGNGFFPATDAEIRAAVQASWDAGVRYFDTSPWYGLGLSERRMGSVLHGLPRQQFTLSTKVGRLLHPSAAADGTDLAMWHDIPPFRHQYDYSAAGVRRSVEDSLQRLGVAQLDIVYIHDISPDNGDMKDRWTEYFDQAKSGAMPELTRMREEGLIKAWGMGVNTLEPALAAFEAADPDIILSATQYSIIRHQDALDRLFPVARTRNASIVVGAPLNAGFLAGRQRYDYRGAMPPDALDKRVRMTRIALDHDVDLRVAALQFASAPDVVAAAIPGARDATQARQNAEALRISIPREFWDALRRDRLIADTAPVPA
ncbi:aldo/keto reductase [Sphingobium sp. YR657]|uniref:aldo/keto reductase n=1 Tax=Sphingobium sp. YR657 TaxID=1884366 RepID=UPI0020C92474|nr:aldo/keto reductase [Sphingobium sp. YR657]